MIIYTAGVNIQNVKNNNIEELFEGKSYEDVIKLMQNYHFKIVENKKDYTRIKLQCKNIKINLKNPRLQNNFKVYQIKDLKKGLIKAKVKI